jgi:ribosomal 50S subunit-associated protein YjgA (DUF615 family)
MDTKSELTVDVDDSISKAYDSSLAAREQLAVREHLAYILTRIREPHTQIEPIKAALATIDNRESKNLPWFQRPVGIVGLAVTGAVIAAGIAKKLGWI